MTYTDFSANRPLFGPSGHSESFTAEGHTATTEMPEWIKARGLDLFEYSFGRGVNISSKTATEIGKKCSEYGVEMSVHAPYFINLAGEEEGAEKSYAYILDSARAARLISGATIASLKTSQR